ncbi:MULTISPECIES: winged helix-turn-helix domain-containing protein [Paenibacillus]|uniref:winged helix-turn-helix domain-containing protein n=1 Tax=Paenibacillus TaxID=44249 RepID=UPI0011A37024|nr:MULTISPECIES: transcriptional regulator [Paenibacillus]MBJ9993650.1 transcriptional regulator [Paenibacillus sp. S28]
MNSSENHFRHKLDELIHVPVRLSIMATLAPAERVDFQFLRDAIEVSDSLLSKHLSVLEAAGYVEVIKGYVGKRPRTWLAITETGRTAFKDYVEVLRLIVDAGPAYEK